jgi:hypothetical protein
MRARAARVIPIGLVGLIAAIGPQVAGAQVLRMQVITREPAASGQAFGAAGAYEIIRGRIVGEVDPGDPHNAIIQDLQLAPRNARGRVEYTASRSRRECSRSVSVEGGRRSPHCGSRVERRSAERF